MSSTQVGAVLGYLHKLAADRNDVDLPDHQLLERFAAHRDEAAFAALLKRHGPMVLGVCRSVLHNLHDAEDAFQAAFLVLARKACSIHRREAVSGWLHRVAYHLAVDAQASAARRRVHEKRAAIMPPADPVLDMSLRELRGILNEELQRLPEEYRAPLVLCALEEKPLEEAARLLGWTKGTVKGRLQRGRERLRQRLRRRGLDVSAGLLAVALSTSSASAQISATLTATTLRAALRIASGERLAAGVVSAQVAALLQGATQTMFLSKVKIVTVLFLVIGAGASALGMAWRTAPAAGSTEARASQVVKPKAPEDRTPSARPAKPQSKESVEISGQVLNPEGKPFAGAKLYFSTRTPKGFEVKERGTSGKDGRFHLSIGKSEMARSGREHPRLLAGARGHGPGWVVLDGSGPFNGLTLRLVKDATVSGRIIDADGKPVANAKLTMDGVAAFTGTKKSGVVLAYTTPYITSYPWDAANGWLGPLPDQGVVLTTSADGRFKLTGVGPDRVVSFHLEGPGIATTDLVVISGTPVQHVAALSRSVRGVVRDKATGKPLAGATVYMTLGGWWWDSGFEEDTDGMLRWGKTVTDKEGRYELLGLAKPPNHKLGVKPPKGQLYFKQVVGLGDPPGLAALVADIDMVQGVTVRGKLTDKATHQPIAGAQVFYGPLIDNPTSSRGAVSSEAITEPDGSYALTVHPGPGVIAVMCRNPHAYMHALVTTKEVKEFFTIQLRFYNDTWLGMATGGPLLQANYNALVLLEPKEGDKALVKDIALERARERKGRVVGPDGQPIRGVTVQGLLPGQWGQHTETLQGTEFTVRGINPRAKRQIVFHHQEKNLGYCLKELPDEKLGPLTIKLQPCGSVSGRLVDPDGMPVVNNRRVYILWPQFLTPDKDGRFHVQGLVPGLGYSIMDNKRVFELRGGIVVVPGKDKDLGDIKVSDN